MKRLKMRVFLVVICLALPIRAPASSSNALKRYQSGKYESALREYKRLLIENPDDPRLHFNAGAAAFQVEDFEEAQKQLNSALVTQDLQLQERAYYNLGNTEYRLGAAAQAPDKKQAGWEQAVASYESALKLNPKDDDAKFNLEFVKEKIEELHRARAEAEEAVRRRKYKLALDIMKKKLAQGNPTREETEYVKRLKDVVDIEDPNPNP